MTSPERARLGVAVLFAVNGASFATVLPRYPALKDQLGLSNAEFGMVIAAGPFGALVLGALAGIVTARWGSSRVATAASAALGLNLLLVALAPSVPVAAAAVLATALGLAGAIDTVADVAENTQALRVQSLLGRSVLNSLHGAWSVGAAPRAPRAPRRLVPTCRWAYTSAGGPSSCSSSWPCRRGGSSRVRTPGRNRSRPPSVSAAHGRAG